MILDELRHLWATLCLSGQAKFSYQLPAQICAHRLKNARIYWSFGPRKSSPSKPPRRPNATATAAGSLSSAGGSDGTRHAC
jgi:hypothetical protein